MNPPSQSAYRAPLGEIEVEEAFDRIAELAESCGGAWNRSGRGGRLAIPVAGGLRRGWTGGDISIERPETGGGTSELDVVYRLEEENWSLHVPSVAVLGLAGAGALTTVLWPFFPVLLPLAPMGFLLSIAAWFLVVRQIRHRGPQDFLDLVVADLDPDDASDSAARSSEAQSSTGGMS